MLTLRRTITLAVLPLVPLLAAACAGEEAGEEVQAAGAQQEAVVIENAGTLVGRVSFEGAAPAAEPIDMSDEPACAEKHTAPPTRRSVAVNDNGTLRNVFVYVRDGLDRSYPAPGGDRVLDQDGCEYEPHVMGIQIGQRLTIRNSDPVLHNVNTRPDRNRGFNISQPQAGMTSQRTFSTREVMIPVQCDVHGWMQAYIGVLDHPYYAVTGEDGSFRIENLPPGDYVIEAWHERLGTQTISVSVAPDGTAEANFSYHAAAAASAVVPLGRPLDPHTHHAPGAAAAGDE